MSPKNNTKNIDNASNGKIEAPVSEEKIASNGADNASQDGQASEAPKETPEQIKARLVLEAQQAPQDINTLLQAYSSLTARADLEAEIRAKHEKVASMVEAIGLNTEQTAKLRAQNGISDSLDNDLKTLDVPEYLTAHIEALKEPSVSVWREHVAQIAAIDELLSSVNALRGMLGQAELFTAWQTLSASTSGRARTVKGDAGSEAHDNASAKFMRPGLVRLTFANMDIEWRADLEKHTLSVPSMNVSKSYAQGSEIGLASAWKLFIQTELMRPTTNDSLPKRLSDHGYSKEDVYMYQAPTTETRPIKQPTAQVAQA